MRNQLLYYAYKYDGDYFKIKKAFENNEKWNKIDYKGNFITILDPLYPQCFKTIKYSPWVIFYEGNISLLKNKKIAVVGSRESSEYGNYCTSLLIHNIHKEYTVVSGLAKGIDALAHTYSIEEKQSTIGVLGCGLDIIYPKENEVLYTYMKQYELIISEYPNGCKPLAYHFPWRNRLIAALGDILVVVEAKKKSGTMITVGEALEQGKDVYAFPHAITHENGSGCNLLIEQGCGMLNGIEDIKEL